MTEAPKLLSEPAHVSSAVMAAVEWCDDFDLCTAAVDSQLGRRPLWRALLAKRPTHAYVALDGLRSEPHALDELHRHGVLRFVPAADGSFRSNLYRFRHGKEVRIITGSGPLIPEGMMAPLDAVVLWQGRDNDAFALDAERLFARAQQLAHVPEPEELQKYSDMYFETAEHRDALMAAGAPLIRRPANDGELVEFELVTEARAIRDAMRWAKEDVARSATAKIRTKIGHHGGSATKTVHWSAPLGIWSLWQVYEDRYWNCYGIQYPERGRSLQITVEINPPREGIARNLGGAVAQDAATGRRYFVHRGRIGGGQKGIGAQLFWNHFRGGVPLREPDREAQRRVVVVGEIETATFSRDLAAFVHEVARIKHVAG